LIPASLLVSGILTAYFSDRGRPFRADRERRNGVAVAALGKRAGTGLTVHGSSTISLKRAAVGWLSGVDLLINLHLCVFDFCCFLVRSFRSNVDKGNCDDPTKHGHAPPCPFRPWPTLLRRTTPGRRLSPPLQTGPQLRRPWKPSRTSATNDQAPTAMVPPATEPTPTLIAEFIPTLNISTLCRVRVVRLTSSSGTPSPRPLIIHTASSRWGLACVSALLIAATALSILTL
jgi:hypothetical protein